MGWKPLNEVYFVRPDEIKVSPLVLEQYKADHAELRTGIITHVGTGTLMDSGHRSPLQASLGDKILFGSKVGSKVDVEGEKLLLLAEANVLAVWKMEDSDWSEHVTQDSRVP